MYVVLLCDDFLQNKCCKFENTLPILFIKD